MSKSKISITLTILTYSLFISALFLLFSMNIQTTIRNIDEEFLATQSGAYSILTDPQQQISEQVQETVLPAETVHEFKLFYDQRLMEILFPSAVGFCFLVAATSILLWWRLNQIKKREDQQIVHELMSIEWDEEVPKGNEALRSAYQYIKEQYEQHMQGFHRLQAYLSHDQRNTLMILKNNLNKGKVEAALKNTQSLTDRVDDILTLSDIQASKEGMCAVDVIIICADICDTYQSVYPNITFTFPDKELYVWAKPRWIRQAVGNLIDNAVKYGENKEIILLVKELQGCVIIQVQDHGIGIAPEKQEAIFQHNYRINELNKDGYGLGLSLVEHVCDLCNGCIYCESEQHQGTTFILSFQKYNLNESVNIQ